MKSLKDYVTTEKDFHRGISRLPSEADFRMIEENVVPEETETKKASEEEEKELAVTFSPLPAPIISTT